MTKMLSNLIKIEQGLSYMNLYGEGKLCDNTCTRYSHQNICIHFVHFKSSVPVCRVTRERIF